MATLRVTARSQVTFSSDVLKHLGIHPGDEIQVDLLPGGRVGLQANHARTSWRELQGLLKKKTNGARFTIEEIGDAIAEAGAEAGLRGLTRK